MSRPRKPAGLTSYQTADDDWAAGAGMRRHEDAPPVAEVRQEVCGRLLDEGPPFTQAELTAFQRITGRPFGENRKTA